MFDSLNSVWGHLVHFAKYPMLRYSGLLLPQFLAKFNQTLLKGMIIRGKSGCYFCGDLPNFKSILHFEEKLPHLHCNYP